jgi:ribosomal protein S18 acetylase RimI-like enzyme
MSTAWQVQPVPPDRCDEAMMLLMAGASDDGLAAVRAEALKALLQRRGQYPPRLWWARQNRRTVAAAMVMDSPGRSGILLHASADAAGVEREALAETASAASRDALQRRGLAFVQAMFDPRETWEMDMVLAAGFEFLAGLVHMKLELTSFSPSWQKAGLSWQRFGEFSEGQLADLIAATYDGSLDCPRLSGLRGMSDVLESHKACGVFHPASWWIVVVEGTPVGCVLVNDSASGQTAEVVYLGVVATYRRRGVARAMLRRASDEAYRRRRSALLLAVDEENHHAMRLYEEEGFRNTHRQWAFFMTPAMASKG